MTDREEPLRVVVADDEPLALQTLVRELSALGCCVVATAASGNAALDACLQHRPHVCFADIAMPDRDGLSLARALRVAAPLVRVVFVTAHPHHAVDAFAEDVADFVPKPLRPRRLADAVARARRALSTGVDEARLVVGERGAQHILAVREIEWVQADGATLWLHTAHRAWAQRERMQRMEELLIAQGFVRVHRSALVRLGAVVSFTMGEDRARVLQLRSGARVRVARDRVAEVKAALAGADGKRSTT